MAKKNPTEEEVRAAYKEVLGRNPDKGGLENYMKSGLSGDALKKDLASSVEASRRKGLDVTKYGVKVRDKGSLNQELRDTFDRYKNKFGWDETKITDSIVQELEGVAYLFKTDEGRKQFESGNIEINPGSGGEIQVVISKEAVRALGTDLGVHIGGAKGTQYYFPTKIDINGEEQNVFLSDKRFADASLYKVDGKETGWSTTARIDAPKSGVFGAINEGFKSLGMSDDLAATATLITTGGASAGQFGSEVLGIKESYFITDPLNLDSGIKYGTEGYQGNVEGAANVFNTSEEKAARGQAVGQAVAQAVVSTINPFAGAAFASVSAANRAAAGQAEWRDVAVTSAVAFATAGLADYFNVSSMSTTGQVSYQAASSAASTATTQYLSSVPPGQKRTVDWSKVGEAAALSAAGTALTLYMPRFEYTYTSKLGKLKQGTISPWATALNAALADSPYDRAASLASFAVSSSAALSPSAKVTWDPNIVDPRPGEDKSWFAKFTDAHSLTPSDLQGVEYNPEEATRRGHPDDPYFIQRKPGASRYVPPITDPEESRELSQSFWGVDQEQRYPNRNVEAFQY